METLVFGGSFNPPTRAHEAVIRACLEAEKFDEVWVMPSAERYDKSYSISDEHRIRMLELMHYEVFKMDPRLVVSRFEVDEMERPTQTWRTVKSLAEIFRCRRFTFVFGADSYIDMLKWEHGEKLQAELNILIVPRNGLKLVVSEQAQILPVEAENISSTNVRDEVRAGRFIGAMVCESVMEYINAQNLYQV